MEKSITQFVSVMSDEFENISEDIEMVCKFMMCVMLAQSGKTFWVIDRIKKTLEEEDRNKHQERGIHMVFTMNTLMNNCQFAHRLYVIEETYGKGSVCVFASKYEGEYTSVNSLEKLLGRCSNKKTCPRVVIMCSNPKRFDDGFSFMETVNDNHNPIDRIYAYYDEIHEYLTPSLRNQIEQLNIFTKCIHIFGLTATPYNVWQDTEFWSKIHTVFIADYSEADYAGCGDMIFNCIDDFSGQMNSKQCIEYVSHILDKFPSILADGTRTFIPANKNCSSHNEMRDLIFERKPNAIVVVLNGGEKTMCYYDNNHIKTIPLITMKGGEISETIYKKTHELHLESRPCVITGFICVSMGQTLMHKLLGNFTSAIFSHMDLCNDDIYQLVARIFGRIKNWDNYCITQVYCPKVIMDRCQKIEECSRKIVSRINYHEEVTRNEYTTPIREQGKEDIVCNFRDNRGKKTKKIKHDMVCHTVPIICPLTENEYNLFAEKTKGSKGKYDRQSIFNFLHNKFDFDWLESYTVDENCLYQISCNTTHNAYKKFIQYGETTSNAYTKCKPPGLKFTKEEDKTKQWWLIYIDGINKDKLVIYRWDGSKLSTN